MNLSRRHLPSTSGLTALEALARLESVTAAAEELNLTQSAVSRQLQALEAQLGVELFVRTKKRVALTPAGQRYADEVRQALDRLTTAALRLQTNPEGGALSLAILPTFGMRWLVPRLPRFARAHPDVTVNMTTRINRIDFGLEPFDAALSFGNADWPNTRSMLLEDETVLPVAAPQYLAATQLREPDDLRKQPLLHIQTRPEAWNDWFEQHGVERSVLPGTRYDQFATILQAARHGLGIALIPEYLAREEIAEGRLAPAFGPPCPSRGAYHLIWPEDRHKAPALTAFRNWLMTEINEDEMLPR
ncbi:transcriptional regulator GcvA [Lentibacter algarum]|uniref:transcriptional regulator GcvA n=1 Tax=Lentibacter algarum TaxID=576131 RepID=UPI001C06CF51|nr:transcriptional regulator GcvA [Lentibacter algarum]MBU2982360.1 transcriptional regulator GcvA [Lentibacter algarum]